MSDNLHIGNVIPVPPEGRQCAYENEPVSTQLVLRAHPAQYEVIDGRKVPSREGELWNEYTLAFTRHTGNALVVTLRKVPATNVFIRQRDERGYGTEAEVYTTTLSFAEIVNRLLGPGCMTFEDHEAFPSEIVKAMRGAYGR